MGHLNFWEIKSLLESVERLHEDIEPESLPERMRAAVAMIIPSEANCLEIFDKDNHPTILGAYPDNFFPPKSLEVLEFFLDEHPFFEPVNVQRTTKPLKISDFYSPTEFRKTRIYNEVYRELNVVNQLVIGFKINPDETFTCCLSRGRRDFSEAERLMLELLAPHLLTAFRRSRSIVKLCGSKANGVASEAARQSLLKTPLTNREIEILILLTKGKTDKEIAYLCRISPRTVQNHLSHIYDKLGVDNRTSAVSLMFI